MANVLMLTRGTGGDFYPFARIGVALKARGHKVTLITHRHYGEATQEAGLGFVPLDPAEDLTHTGDTSVARTIPDLLADLREGLATIAPACQRFAALLRAGSGNVIVANHNSFVAARIFSEKYRLPLMSLFVAPAFVANMPVHEALYRRAADDINRVREILSLLPVRDWHAWWHGLRWNLGLWPAWFAEPDAGWPAGLVPVGFVFEAVSGSLPEDLRAILREATRPVLLTHGTAVPPKAEFFRAGVEACRRLGRTCVLVTPHDVCVPAPLPGGVRHFRFLPFDTALPHFEAMIHHGGIGTLGLALAAGVPQVVLPMGIDRPDNARRLQRLGVGRHLPPLQWTPEAVVEALEQLTGSSAVKERCAALSVKFDGIDPLARTCDVVEDCLRHWDGSVNQPVSSPGDVPGAVSSEVPDRDAVENSPADSLSAERRALLALKLAKTRNS